MLQTLLIYKSQPDARLRTLRTLLYSAKDSNKLCKGYPVIDRQENRKKEKKKETNVKQKRIMEDPNTMQLK